MEGSYAKILGEKRLAVPHEAYQFFVDKFLDAIEVLEDRNRAIAYVMHADTSGWDADQILRPIWTTNHKRNLPVVIKEWER